MTGIRSIQRLVPALIVALLGFATVFVPAAGAFQIEDRGTNGLDGTIVMSPANERIATVEAGGGEPVAPGATVKRPLIIHNRTTSDVVFDLDVAQVVGSDAELVVEVLHGVREGAAAWVKLERRTLTLEPGEQGTVNVTIRIPDDIKPGSKPFAVSATQRSAPAQDQGAGIAPKFVQTAIFVVELPGDAPIKGGLTNARITSAQKSAAAGRDGSAAPSNPRVYVSPGWTDEHDLRLTAEYANEGERLLSPTGRVVVRDVLGRIAGRFDIEPFTVYPGGESASTIQLKGLPSLGLFQATVELESVAAGTQETTLPRFMLVPKWLLAVLAAFAAYGLFRLARWRLRRRREWRRYLNDDGSSSMPAGGADADDVDAWEAADPDDVNGPWARDDEPERMT